MRDQNTGIEARRRFDQVLQRVPRSLLVRNDPHKPLVKLIAFQEMTRVAKKCAVDEGETDMVGLDRDLAYPGADWPSAPLIKVDEAISAGKLGSLRRHRSDDIPEFPDDVAQLRTNVLQVLLDGMG